MKELFDSLSEHCAKITTKRYSTSFSLGIRFLAKDLRAHVYNIYGFVRVADEIVDSFHGFDQEELLGEFNTETWRAIDRGISTNPILHAFQHTVNTFDIDRELISTFLKSMEMDLSKREYTEEELSKYILGSAEVVGLMCLQIFTRGNKEEYQKLKEPAMKLGSAFQKVNFLRDLGTDYQVLQRSYFPELNPELITDMHKMKIEEQIETEMLAGYEGIKQLPKDSRFGVYLAFKYFYRLLQKIKKTRSEKVLKQRIRVSDHRKYAIFIGSLVRHQVNML